MRILGLHDGHTGTACLLEDGRVRGAISEERLTKIKGFGGFPVQAVKLLMEREDLSPDDIDQVALVGFLKPLKSIQEYRGGRQKYFPQLIKFFPGDPRSLIQAYMAYGGKNRLKDAELTGRLAELGLPLDKVELVEHHQAHAATAYYLSPFQTRREKALIVTLDGSGDGLSGTVSVVDEKGQWTRLKNISTFDSLGMVYSRVTQYLAMKPWEHEYKLMGMAPYASEEYARKAREVLAAYIQLAPDGLGFENPNRLWGNSLLNRMFKDFRGDRFDAVSAGVQLLHEELATALIRNWLRETGLRRLAVAGGSFMNVKANKLLVELDELDELFVMPSGGDESCAVGAAIWCCAQQQRTPAPEIAGLTDLYWGPDYSDAEAETAFAEEAGAIEYRRSDDVERETAQLLAEHNIVGRLSGRMEWGARALGNRSIVANPSRPQNLRKLNAAIKMRDFWMPFAPSILWERRNDYAVVAKDIASHHMTLAYDSTPLAREQLIAALHPYDFTMRPQFVTREHNPRYHRLLSEFEKLTSIGGVLNTSFNLHGEPIVCSPTDALRTLLRSELDYVTVNDYLVWKKRP